MAAQFFTLGALLATSAAAYAIPLSNLPRLESALQTRQSTSNPTASWVSSDQGNIVFVFSDTTIGFGSAAPSDVAGQLGGQCYDAGICNTTPWTVSASVPASGGGTSQLIITIATEGDYPSWAHNGLVDVFQAAVGAIQTSESVTYSPSNCATQGCVYQDPVTINQYKAPQYMALVFQSSDSNAAPIGSITMSISTELVGDEGFCSTFFDIGSTVAGVVNGAAGAAFSLLGLACQ